MSLSNVASKSVDELTCVAPSTFFRMYWTGDRDVMIQRMQRAQAVGAVGLIATLDWSFSMGRDWGSPRDDVPRIEIVSDSIPNRLLLTQHRSRAGLTSGAAVP